MASRRRHITIQEGKTLPELTRCIECCKDFHCPFCSPTLFHPTKLSKVRAHLETHFNRAVLHDGYAVHRCGLNCRPQWHYHCIYCQSMLLRKPDFIRHLSFCQKKHLTVNKATTTTPSFPAPPAPKGPKLPLSSVRLLVPPVRLMSAWMWEAVQQGHVDQYGKLVEFISLVTETLPELLSFKERTQLILGLKTRLILEMLQRDSYDCQTIEEQLQHFKLWAPSVQQDKGQEEEVRLLKENFVETIQTLLSDVSEKECFFKEIFPALYGSQFDTALQTLVWEFFSRVEEFLSVPSFSQIASGFYLPPLDSDEFDSFFTCSDNLKTLLHHQDQYRMPKRVYYSTDQSSFGSDIILSSLASKRTSEGRKEDMGLIKVENDSYSDNAFNEADASKLEPQQNIKPSLDSSPVRLTQVEDEMPADTSAQDHNCSESQENVKCAPNSEGIHSGNDLIQDSTITGADDSIPPLGGAVAPSARKTKKFPCPQCGKKFTSTYYVKRHQSSVHALVRPFGCNWCEKRFATKNYLKDHLKIHTDHKPHVCPYCNRAFRYKVALKTHERIHTGERPFACTMCDKKFNQISILTTHLRVHRSDRPFLCSDCGKTFNTSGSLLVHSRQHTGERPYQCDICAKTYATSSILRVHQRQHTGERPFACTFCEKSFFSRSRLKLHTNTHTGEKPFLCNACGRRFASKGNMKLHMRKQLH